MTLRFKRVISGAYRADGEVFSYRVDREPAHGWVLRVWDQDRSVPGVILLPSTARDTTTTETLALAKAVATEYETGGGPVHLNRLTSAIQRAYTDA